MKFKLLFILLFCFGVSTSFAQNQMSTTKQAILSSVEKHEANLIKISNEIWALAETALEEKKSS